MFSIFNRKKKSKGFPYELLKTDMHSHLIPGVDDGSPDIEASIFLIQGMLDLGFEKLITTPHIMGDLYKNTPEILEEHYLPLKAEMARQNMQVNFSYAAEYLLDDIFEERLQREEPLLRISADKVLVELSFVNAPLQLKEQFFEIQMRGYQPVLAHVERYPYFHRNKRQFDQMKHAGILFQGNLLSFSGYYGKAAQESAEWLAQHNYYNLLGTDLHHERHLEQLQFLPFTSHLKRVLDSPNFFNREL